MRLNIACYLTSHGFGHAVRSETVIRAMALEEPDWNFFIVSGSPSFLFRTLLQLPNVHLRAESTDFGLIQKDPRTFSLEETADRLRELTGDYGKIVERETAFLDRERINGVYCDIPFLPFLAADSRKLPSCGMGNFTWDWIYYYYHETDPVFEHAARLAYRCYKKCGLYLALPSSPEPLAFDNVEAVPLVCRKPALSGDVIREELGIRPDERAVLIGFSGLSLTPAAIRRVNRIRNTVFLLPEPLDIDLERGIRVPFSQMSFHNLTAACDVILTKPGYGIISDAIAGHKPLITTERGDFPEVPYLIRLLEQSIGHTPLSRKAFESGKWSRAVREAAARPHNLPIDGTRIAAERLLAHFNDGTR